MYKTLYTSTKAATRIATYLHTRCRPADGRGSGGAWAAYGRPCTGEQPGRTVGAGADALERVCAGGTQGADGCAGR